MNDDCLKLTTYFGERDRAGGELVADALLDIYGRHEVEASVLLRGIEGFGAHHRLRTDRLLTLSEDLPVVSVAVDRGERVRALLEEVLAVRHRGLVTLERARMIQGDLRGVKIPAQDTKLTVYVGRHERIEGRPAFLVICQLMFERGLDGATVLLGVDGTAHGVRRRARFMAANADVPAMIIAVGSGERIAAVLHELGSLLPRPLITLERVRVCKRDGQRLARPQEVPGHDEEGLPLWQKLMVYSSEHTLHHGTPLHVAIVRGLRERGARGATCVRGVWGFHGGEPPHGDRLLQIRRRVPVVTSVIDSPERIADCYEVIDEVTVTRGLVTSELVPAAAEPDDAGSPKVTTM